MRVFGLQKSIRLLLSGVVLLLATAQTALAAPPKVNHLFPAGGQRGQTVKVTAAGEFSTWPVEIWSDYPGVSVTAEADKGKIAVQLDADAPPGIAWLRFHNGEGASTLQPFVIGTLEEVEEKEPNDAPSNPQQVAPRVVVNGRLQKGGDADGYKVSLKQGETLVAALQAHTQLGSPVDSVMQICEIVERKSLPDVPALVEAYMLQHDHDSCGLDPRLIFTAPRDGDYLVRIFGFPSEPNSSIAYSGAESYIYRLTLTTGPYVIGALPSALPPEGGEIEFTGWNLPSEGLRASIPAAADLPEANLAPPRRPFSAAPAEAGGFAALVRTPYAVAIAAAASSPQNPQPITVPVTVTGQLRDNPDGQAFEFEAAKGKKLRLSVEASSLGFPWDPKLVVTDAAGKLLTEADDVKGARDPEIVFNPPADGKYRVIIRDLAENAALDFLYRLTVEPAEPDIVLTLAADSFTLAADKPAEVTVNVERREGFAEPITVRIASLPEGVTAEEVVSEPSGDSSKSVKLTIKPAGDLAAAKGGPIVVEGRTADGNKVRRATFSVGKPLAAEHSAAWLSVTR